MFSYIYTIVTYVVSVYNWLQMKITKDDIKKRDSFELSPTGVLELITEST